jgi:glyoxylase-like metal-dependent hydrolase (beta-lactamase superfamily II)
MRIHHLSCGTLCPFGGRLLSGRGSLFATAKMVCHCLLVESRDGLVLVDTGFGLADVASPRRLGAPFLALTRPRLDRGETAIEQVRARGFSPGDVRHVVVTHLDLDHAGGLSDFPEAEVHVTAAEHAAAMSPPTLPEQQRYRAVQWAHEPNWHLHRPDGERFHGFERAGAVGRTDDEVLMIPLPGHTRGHAAVAVKADHGWLIHAGDAYFFRGEMARDYECPPVMRVFQTINAVDDDARVRNRERLRALALERPGEIRVMCAHDPVELEQMRDASTA